MKLYQNKKYGTLRWIRESIDVKWKQTKNGHMRRNIEHYPILFISFQSLSILCLLLRGFLCVWSSLLDGEYDIIQRAIFYQKINIAR